MVNFVTEGNICFTTGASAVLFIQKGEDLGFIERAAVGNFSCPALTGGCPSFQPILRVFFSASPRSLALHRARGNSIGSNFFRVFFAPLVSARLCPGRVFVVVALASSSLFLFILRVPAFMILLYLIWISPRPLRRPLFGGLRVVLITLFFGIDQFLPIFQIVLPLCFLIPGSSFVIPFSLLFSQSRGILSAIFCLISSAFLFLIVSHGANSSGGRLIGPRYIG